MMFGWGLSSSGELGLGGIEADIISSPQRLEFNKSADVVEVGCGVNHSGFVLRDGAIYTCGSNDFGQLGHKKSRMRPEKVDSLLNHVIKYVSCGRSHTLTINEWGQIFSWGQNDHGQLGQGRSISDSMTHVAVPKMVRSLATLQVIQVACGYDHSLALISNGQVYSWGSNSHGQLGLGASAEKLEDRPCLIQSLNGIPLSQVRAGGYFSFVLSVSGAIFGWGKNSFGQLGLEDRKDRSFPCLVSSIRSQKICYMSCGEDHTAALTLDGRLFTWGSGSYGQLGHNSKNNEVLPRQVIELSGTVVTQVACGRKHTVAFVPNRGRLYSFGLGGSGQLGNKSVSNKISPVIVPGPWLSGQINTNMEVDEPDEDGVVIHKIFSGGAQNFVITSQLKDKRWSSWLKEFEAYAAAVGLQPGLQKSAVILHCAGLEVQKIADSLKLSFSLPYTDINKLPPVDMRFHPPDTQIQRLEKNSVSELLRFSEEDSIPQEIMTFVEKIFSSCACLNCSYLTDSNGHYGCSKYNTGVNLALAKDEFRKIQRHMKNSRIVDLIADCLQCALKQLLESPPDIEAIRLYLLLPNCHLFMLPEKHLDNLIVPFASALNSLNATASKIIDFWWSKMDASYFICILEIFKNTIVYIITLPFSKEQSVISDRKRWLRASLLVLSKLRRVNVEYGNIVSHERFYIAEVTDHVNIKIDYVNWLQTSTRFSNVGEIFMCDYPFIFDACAKALLLQTDAAVQMQLAMDEVHRRNITSFMMFMDPVNPYLVLYVTRDNIVMETLTQLQHHNSCNISLKKPLKVIFHGEEAVDAGGVRKEFFLLLLKELLDPKFGMFTRYTDTMNIWFCETTYEEDEMFKLVGTVCGLAIYNFTIIDLPFPIALYKKLLNRKTRLSDLYGLSPMMAKSLNELLQYKGTDFEDLFELTFEITRENFGHAKTYELKPGGRDTAVNQTNKHEYVELYVDYIFNKCVEKQYGAFHRGFHQVCGGRVLELFQPEELMEMVIGNENYDWTELEKNTEYKEDYGPSNVIIRRFWRIFHTFSLQEKKKFLLFLTGSDRIPILGMKDVKLVIQPMNVGDDYMPVAHTCFNLLDLPRYTSDERLKTKILQAIEHTQGFGIA